VLKATLKMFIKYAEESITIGTTIKLIPYDIAVTFGLKRGLTLKIRRKFVIVKRIKKMILIYFFLRLFR